MHLRFTQLVGLTAAVMLCAVGGGALYAQDLLIGGFNGTFDSSLGTSAWYADIGITGEPDPEADPPIPAQPVRTQPELIDNTSPWAAGITEGTGAVKFTFPRRWAYVERPLFRLDAGRDLMNALIQKDVNDEYIYSGISMDVTTFRIDDDPETPENEQVQPVWRQAFILWQYTDPWEPEFPGATQLDRNDDTDAQQDFPVPSAAGPRTYTIELGIDDPSGVGTYVNGDDKVPIQFKAQEIADYEAGSGPITDYAFNLMLVFQGDDLPTPADPTAVSSDVFVVIDNIRLTQAAPVILPGDYNDDGTVDVLDYVRWRNSYSWIDDPNDPDDQPAPLMNETEDIGTFSELDFNAWKANFGATGGAGSGAGSLAAGVVPEPTSIMLVIAGAMGLLAFRRVA